MRFLVMPIIMLIMAATALAADWRPNPATRPAPTASPPAPDPMVIRQGGDTIADALVIDGLPFETTGTTVGYTDDYDEVCPYEDSVAPDVVYAYTPGADIVVDIDLCGSSYDTKLYVYDEHGNIVACNDDAYGGEPCGLYVSALEAVTLGFGLAHYIVIDGYGDAAGEYVLAMREHVPCELDCPDGYVPEGEPPLVDGYRDEYNSGCNGHDVGYPFQELYGDASGELRFCGVSGWFRYSATTYRDTDWFILTFDTTETITVTGDAEQPTYLWVKPIPDCATLDAYPIALVGDCQAESATLTGSEGQTTWFMVMPTVFHSPDANYPFEYDYILQFSGLAPAPVAIETRNWSTIKQLFR